jgi:hypothetical protein
MLVEPKVWIIVSYCMVLLEVMIKAGLYSGASCNMSRKPHHEGLPQCVQNGIPPGKFMTGELGNQVSKVFKSKWV